MRGSDEVVLACYQPYRWYLSGWDSVNCPYAELLRNWLRVPRRRCASAARAPTRSAARRSRCRAKGTREGGVKFLGVSEARLHDGDRKLARTALRAHRVYDAAAADRGLEIKTASARRHISSLSVYELC